MLQSQDAGGREREGLQRGGRARGGPPPPCGGGGGGVGPPRGGAGVPPPRTASPAVRKNRRESWTGSSVMSAMRTPASMSMAGLSRRRSRVSSLPPGVSRTLMATGTSAAASRSATLKPSEPWCTTSRRPNSSASRSPVTMSSARWACRCTMRSPRRTSTSASASSSSGGGSTGRSLRRVRCVAALLAWRSRTARRSSPFCRAARCRYAAPMRVRGSFPSPCGLVPAAIFTPPQISARRRGAVG